MVEEAHRTPYSLYGAQCAVWGRRERGGREMEREIKGERERETAREKGQNV